MLKTIEAFAVECSINKVWTSEALGLRRGRGGPGVWRQRLLARVPGRAGVSRRAHHAHLRRHQRDQPPAHPDTAAQAVAGTLQPRWRQACPGHADPSESPDGALAAERMLVSQAKRLAVAALGHAAAVYGDAVKDEQEILGHVADMSIEIYASESAIGRAEKLLARSEERSRLRGRHRRASTPTRRPTA